MCCAVQGVAGLFCQKKLPDRPSGDGMEAGAADRRAVASSVQASSSSDNQLSVSLADSSGAVGSTHMSSSVVTGRQQVDAVTDQLVDIQLSDGGLRQRLHNGQHRDIQETVLGHNRHQSADRN